MGLFSGRSWPGVHSKIAVTWAVGAEDAVLEDPDRLEGAAIAAAGSLQVLVEFLFEGQGPVQEVQFGVGAGDFLAVDVDVHDVPLRMRS